MILVAGLFGFILGSRAGRAPYERLEKTLTSLRGRPEVQGVVDTVQDEVNQRAGEFSNKVQSKMGVSRDIGVA